MSKILVTGANGLVGYAIRDLNPADVIYITKKHVDLTDFQKTKALFEEIKPEKVIHLAAVVGGIGGNIIHSGEYFRNNIMINTNVLECARAIKVKKLISFMSTCVFPDKCSYPLNENNLHDGPPHPSNFGYAYAKRMLEVQSSAYRKEWNCDYIVAIPTNIYGPNDFFNINEGHVLPSLIHKIYLAKKNNNSLTIWGSGKPLREFVYSKDIARLILWAVDNYSEDSPIIFSSGIEISVNDLVNIIIKKMDFNGDVLYDSDKPDGQYRKPSDISKLKKYLPEFEFTTIDKGISETINWFVSNYDTARL